MSLGDWPRALTINFSINTFISNGIQIYKVINNEIKIILVYNSIVNKVCEVNYEQNNRYKESW